MYIIVGNLNYIYNIYIYIYIYIYMYNIYFPIATMNTHNLIRIYIHKK